MIKRLEGKVALITGAGSGMGAAQAKLFAKEGAKVLAGDINGKGITDTVAAIEKDGGTAIAIKLDVSSTSDWEQAISEVHEHFGKLDILINTAGIVGPAETKAAAHDFEAWHDLLTVNLTGPFLGSKYAIKEMLKTGGGSIVHIASIGATLGDQGGTGYGASKAGVLGLSKHIAVDYAKDNIRSNVILPGQITTPMSSFLETEEAKETKDFFINKTPLGHFGDTDDIAYATLFLASEEAKFITGSELYVDGGVHAN